MIAFKNRAARVILPVSPDNQRLWEEYCVLRDKVIAAHHECQKLGVRTPRNQWLFAVGRDPFRRFSVPEYIYPRSLTRWLRQAIRRCQKALEFPESI